MSKWTPIVVLIVLAAALVLGCTQEQAETEVPPAVEETVDAAVEDAAEAVGEAVEAVGEAVEQLDEAVEEVVPDTE